jgi:hypothetical protein
VGHSLRDEFVNVNIQCELNEILQTFRKFVLFELQISEDYYPPIQNEKMHLEYLSLIPPNFLYLLFNYQKSQTKKIYYVKI